jgi:hypothetical protein
MLVVDILEHGSIRRFAHLNLRSYLKTILFNLIETS